ncbi:DNA-binding transcriptional regulator, HxlR family [Parafrankia irregularis]|uniref:DNA-binding transcriptional regulator, HxlR family n=1 Tax=Parafrankia irregularis TaxID=795642 RepID=A0A0S4QFQ6_9ACTN|nr:helix-turn-helix transcriptional regulator [Parafrankia sp. CH37]CUU54002.1 DNA-binding transcriptional regulator, HxlR family [Parafrankia irregularis]
MVSTQLTDQAAGQIQAGKPSRGTEPTGDHFDELRAFFADGVFPSSCPTRTVLDHVMSRWGVLVLLTLAERTLRWGELRRAVQGVSEKMLAQTLRTLEQDGLVHREAFPVIPPHVEYSLTELGSDLAIQMAPLMAWIARHADEIVARSAQPT